MRVHLISVLLAAALTAACGGSSDTYQALDPEPDPPEATPQPEEPAPPPTVADPGTGPWEAVASDDVAEFCGLDPDLLAEADAAFGVPWAVVRHGRLCHEFHPDGSDQPTYMASATKTMSAVVVGMVVRESRDFPRDGRQTGPLLDTDRVDHWLDEFTFNPDAQIAHVLGMVAFNENLSWGNRVHDYDANGNREINRLSDVMNLVIAQDPERLGSDVEEFTQRYLYERLGMTDSTWTGGAPDKILAYSWNATLRDMARVGQLILRRGKWNGEQLVDPEWITKMTHPAFEDANTSYGYLTWMSSRSDYSFGGILGGVDFTSPIDPCSPAAIWPADSYPHGISEATDCNYSPPWDCQQDYDVGVWAALGAGGQVIVGHPGLDMVIVAKNLGDAGFWGQAWGPMREALVALDPVYQGDVEAFCEDYGASRYAPNLMP